MAEHINRLPDLQTAARLLGGETSGGQILAPGPGHSAQDRSLSIKIDHGAPDGFVIHSFSGDDAIACRDHGRQKLGLSAFKPNGGRHRACDDAIGRALMAAVNAQHAKPKGRLVAAYRYTDANGTLLYEVLRYEPKTFRQRRPDGNGGWTWKLDDRRVPYRWLDLLKYPDATVFICEGEQDADRVAELGHCATTVATGKWTDDCIEALAGRDVIILEDNDAAGRKKALEVATALHGAAKSIRIVSLPDLPDKGDVSDWLDADPRRAEKLADVCFDAPLWLPDADTETKSKTEAKAEPEQAETNNNPQLPFLNIAAWQDQPVPEREWTVKDRIPANNVTLLSGEGSVGKSILSLQLAVAVVLGRDWLGALPEPGPVLVVCCEDDAGELWRRLDLIFAHYRAAYTEFGDMHLVCLAGQDTLMAAPDRNAIIKPTKLFTRVHEAACNIRPRLIALDNSADIFGGNENDRAQVRQFIGLLRGLAMAAGAGVLLTSHPSLTGISTGTGLSGSTAWNASVRSRLYFRRAVTDKDEEPDPDLRVLEVMKSNYGPIGETINLRWKDGLFVPVGGVTNLEKLAAEQACENLFLEMLSRFNQQNRTTCDKPTANNYAPTVFAKEKAAKAAGMKKRDFEIAMRSLFEAGRIILESYGPPSWGRFKLVQK